MDHLLDDEVNIYGSADVPPHDGAVNGELMDDEMAAEEHHGISIAITSHDQQHQPSAVFHHLDDLNVDSVDEDYLPPPDELVPSMLGSSLEQQQLSPSPLVVTSQQLMFVPPDSSDSIASAGDNNLSSTLATVADSSADGAASIEDDDGTAAAAAAVAAKASEDDEDLFDTVLTSGSGASDGEKLNGSAAGSGKVIADGSGGKGSSGVMTSSSSARGAPVSSRRHCIYVANMTWWTSDRDLVDCVDSVGIEDLVEVKFYENRLNGQSKGYALLSFDHNDSILEATDKLPQLQLHGQQLVVLPFTRASLQRLEQAQTTRRAGDDKIGAKGSGGGGGGGGGGSGASTGISSGGGTPVAGGNVNYMGTVRLGGAPQMQAGHPMMQPQPLMMGYPHPQASLPPNMIYQGVPMASYYPASAAQQIPPQYAQAAAALIPPGAPAPHVNPHFFPMVAAGNPMLLGNQHFGRAPASRGELKQQPQLGEAEVEEIIARNKTVSSSAIARAVSDAAQGDYASAIETLVTAISLIRQSRVTDDERCKVLLESLKDTLHGIEEKSYSHRRRSRSASRSRSRDRHHRHSSKHKGSGGGSSRHSSSRKHHRGGHGDSLSPIADDYVTSSSSSRKYRH